MSRTPTLAEVIDEAIRAGLGDVRVAIPARVEAYDSSTQTVDVKPMIKEVLVDADGNSVTESLPVLPAIPVCFPRGGGFFVSLPLSKGDFVQLLCNDRSIDQWRARGAESGPADLRQHDLSDAVAIPGVYPSTAPLTDASADDLVIGRDGSGPLITMKRDNSILVGRAATLEAARKTDPIEAIIPANTFVTEVTGGSGAPAVGVKNTTDIVLSGEITSGSSTVKIE